jgi:lipopolysaccharide/colanic/teichoic acid biosynthesis glycosyltransferase
MQLTAQRPEPVQQAETEPQTLWGLRPIELHDRFWEARGVEVVRPGDAPPTASARLYLLTDPGVLTIFDLRPLLSSLNMPGKRLLMARLHEPETDHYQERIVSDDRQRFQHMQRLYRSTSRQSCRIGLTGDRRLARQWWELTDHPTPWRALRNIIAGRRRATVSTTGHMYEQNDPGQQTHFVRELARVWQRPDSTIACLHRLTDNVWSDQTIDPTALPRTIGPVWIGAGCDVSRYDHLVGPAVLWDVPEARPFQQNRQPRSLAPRRALPRRPKPRSLRPAERIGKRTFDIAFSLAALAITLPFYPLVMFAIWMEDGRPFFFAHRRESRHGREFPCIKFRTMRKDAEQIKARIQAGNISDGPHFYIENDPRHTCVGDVLRKLNIDELPQFLNVLAGHMSVVGPRPSPHRENQYCPAWREARLSVRPGITGLWQVRRSRAPGQDFQEWIRYDIDYVENLSWRLDLHILGETIRRIFSR